ncbi:MAG: hypothetical protein FWD26_08450 [Treponema sp.]|nr:hypothetical protein [Treponema sp.]
MRKKLAFIALALVLLFFFSCDFELPTAIRIAGSTNFRFAIDIDIGEEFANGLEEKLIEIISSQSELEVIECKNTTAQTYLFYTELLPETTIGLDLSLDAPSTGLTQEFIDFLERMGIDVSNYTGSGEFTYTLDQDEDLIAGDIELPLEGNDMDNFLFGFKFNGAMIQLYISGEGELANLLSIELTIDGEQVHAASLASGQASGIDSWRTNGYTGTQKPIGGIEFPLEMLMMGENAQVEYRVFMEEGTTITPANLFDEAKIKVEAVVWFPLSLKAGPGGVSINLSDYMDDLFSDTDLFGRNSPDEEFILKDIVESLTLEIVFDTNPFTEATLNVTSTGISIPCTLNSTSLILPIDKDTMDSINDPANWPFQPGFEIIFEENAVLQIPRNFSFSITQLALSARIDTRFEF